MMKTKISQHPTLTALDDLKQICKPLQRLNIDYFAHVRIDHEGKFSTVLTSPGFAKAYFKQKFYNVDVHVEKAIAFGKFIVWDALEYSGNSAQMLKTAQDLDHRHAFTICQKSQFGDEYYHFATHINNRSMNQMYLNNVDLLEKFIPYFHQQVQATPKLKEAYDIKFDIEPTKANYSFKSDSMILTPNNQRIEFLRDIQDGITLLNKSSHNEVKLSEQQALCLYHLLQGKSAKLIARDLHISYRTVEHHIENIRKVTGCKSSKELILLYASVLR